MIATASSAVSFFLINNQNSASGSKIRRRSGTPRESFACLASSSTTLGAGLALAQGSPFKGCLGQAGPCTLALTGTTPLQVCTLLPRSRLPGHSRSDSISLERLYPFDCPPAERSFDLDQLHLLTLSCLEIGAGIGQSGEPALRLTDVRRNDICGKKHLPSVQLVDILRAAEQKTSCRTGNSAWGSMRQGMYQERYLRGIACRPTHGP